MKFHRFDPYREERERAALAAALERKVIQQRLINMGNRKGMEAAVSVIRSQQARRRGKVVVTLAKVGRDD